MAVNGKQKGNTFERDIANTLSDRFASTTGIEKPFRRNPDSGAFFGGSNTQRTEIYDTDYAVYGDLICPRNFNFCIECKNYKTPPSFNSLVNQQVTEWDKWLAQSDQDAAQDNKEPMLVIKYNRTAIFVFVNEALDIPLALHYKDRFGYTLDNVLKLPDTRFFQN